MNPVALHSDYKGYSQRGQAWSKVSLDTMMMTIRGKVRSISSRSCTAGGITPTLISTASHASGYCLSHASTSAIIPSGGTPGLTLARYSQPLGTARSESENRKILLLFGNFDVYAIAFASLTTQVNLS